MIDITIQNHRLVEIGNESFDPQMWEDLVKMIETIIEKSLYSGESISLWAVEDYGQSEFKKIVQDWNNPHVSEGRKYVKQITK